MVAAGLCFVATAPIGRNLLAERRRGTYEAALLIPPPLFDLPLAPDQHTRCHAYLLILAYGVRLAQGNHTARSFPYVISPLSRRAGDPGTLAPPPLRRSRQVPRWR